MTIIGIDLGTTNSLVSYWSENGSQLIPNALGKLLTPSVVSLDEDGKVLVGEIAKERMITHPEFSTSVFKRYMGTKKKIQLGATTYLPEELSALVIRSLKEDAEHYLGQSLHEAVISVPAYFSDAQKKATKRAGELAGLKIERLISEPTAAAISYGLHLNEAECKFLVFDLGGGTFDVSILELFDNVMEVRAVAGDNYLGGEDFTETLISMFLKHHSLIAADLDRKTQALIRKQAEQAKQAFCESKKVTMSVSKDDASLTFDISLDEYETATKPIFQKLKVPIERALHDAKLKIKDLDAILLVGGATKLPLIRSFVSRLFGQLAYAHVSPDEAVAIGAGVQAALKGKHAMLKEVFLTDVCPYTLGTSISIRKAQGFHESGHFLPIIERNTTIPVSKVDRLYTIYDNQKVINVDILQGEARLAKDNIFLGELNISVPPKPAGTEAIDIRFTYDINGLLEAEVIVISTGLKKTLVIEKDPGAMTPEEIAQSIAHLAQLKIHPRDQQENRLLIARGERLFEENIGSLRHEIGQLLRSFEDLLDQQHAEQITAERDRIKAIFNSIDAQGGL
ncbi:MAG: molecular chaperone HscC [Candidatus Cohnella colombiensis]|uniref:Chaperone protein DnaK n=1 Tax=Candidatus Cohnella colombiensis TaxID=3121368 RepID=A0AA95F081_9BACL|nr:MAG: molecular chaperone HscC [Cohnella sp.]